jgi:hypothetical protein
MTKNFQCDAAGRGDEEAAAPKSSCMFAVKQAPESIQKRTGRLAFKLADNIRYANHRRCIKNKMQMVSFAVRLDDFAVDNGGCIGQSRNHKVSLQSIEYMTPEFNTPNDVVGKPIATVACCFKTLIPNELAHRLIAIESQCRLVVKRMLQDRSATSSKHYKEVPCVVAKSLSAKYQRNPKCKSVKRIVIPICGDKGKQIKTEARGIRIPALFKKAVIPVFFPRPIVGHVRSVEFYHRGGRWFAKDSKIRSYSERNQWAFAQLESFIRYKSRLAGVTVVEVDAAFTSQTCSRCGHIHKPNGKLFACPACGRQDHRDANASFNIARRGWESIGGLATDSVRRRCGLIIDSPHSGKLEATKI